MDTQEVDGGELQCKRVCMLCLPDPHYPHLISPRMASATLARDRLNRYAQKSDGLFEFITALITMYMSQRLHVRLFAKPSYWWMRSPPDIRPRSKIRSHTRNMSSGIDTIIRDAPFEALYLIYSVPLVTGSSLCEWAWGRKDCSSI